MTTLVNIPEQGQLVDVRQRRYVVVEGNLPTDLLQPGQGPPKISKPRAYLGLRYVLLHSFAHAVMRELVLECGYTAASIRERIYSREPTDENGPMAGVLIYTAAQDSEGTLGGLVEMGRPDQLKPLLDMALENIRLCASDPLCAEHLSRDGQTLHGASCHACLFAPETSCERGNKYLDRSVLVPTVHREGYAFLGDSFNTD